MLRIRPLFSALVLVVLLSGCRIYGEHGSEEAMYRQIHVAIDELEEESRQFEARRPELARTLTVDELDRFTAVRSDMVAHYRDIADRLSPRSGHRELRRIYGSIISDQQIIRDQIAWLEQAASADTLQPVRIGDPRSKYHIVPVFYHRIGMAGGPSARAADAGPADVDVQVNGGVEAAVEEDVAPEEAPTQETNQ